MWWVKKIIVPVVVVILGAAMFMNTKFLSMDESTEAVGEKFSAADYSEENYSSVILPTILEKAVPAVELAAAIAADVDSAGEQHGGRDGTSAWAFPVSFSGQAGTAHKVNGQMPVTVAGIPDDVEILVQMGPPIVGSALRDVTGQISFGLFVNQTEFQQVGQALNDKVRELVLVDHKVADLDGKTVSVTGAFSYDASTSKWLVVPVEISVEG